MLIGGIGGKREAAGGGGGDYEDLTTYDGSDAGEYFTITETRVTFTDMPISAYATCFYNFGIGFFDGDWEVQFEAEITSMDAGSPAGEAVICAITDSPSTIYLWYLGNSQMFISAVGDGDGYVRIQLLDFATDDSDFYTPETTTLPLLYYTFKRTGATATLDIYSNQARTTLVDSLSISCSEAPYRYLMPCSSNGSSGYSTEISGYTQNFELISPTP